MNKRLLIISTILLIFLITIILFLFYKSQTQFNNSLSTGVVHKVVLTKEGFAPKDIKIKLGDSVHFDSELNEPFWPASDLHPTHGIYPEFDPQEPVEASGSGWQFTFDKPGNFRYHDHLSPYYRGTISVTP